IAHDVFPQPVRTNIRSVDRTLSVRHDPRCTRNSADLRLGQIGVRDEGRERAVSCAAYRDAPGVARIDGRIRLRIAHVKRVVVRNIHGTGAAKLLPGGDKVALLVKDLDPAIAAVGDKTRGLGDRQWKYRAARRIRPGPIRDDPTS